MPCPQVVKYLKFLPYKKTQLPRPKSSLVEQLVMSILTGLLAEYQPDAMVGAPGFDALMTKTLAVISGSSTIAHQELLHSAELKFSTAEWRNAAAALLTDNNIGHGSGWLRPVGRVQ